MELFQSTKLIFKYKHQYTNYTLKEKRNIRNWCLISLLTCVIVLIVKHAITGADSSNKNSFVFWLILVMYIGFMSIYMPYNANKLLALRVNSLIIEGDDLTITCCEANLSKPIIINTQLSDIKLIDGMDINVWGLKDKKQHIYTLDGKKHASTAFTISSINGNFPNVLLVPDFFQDGEILLEKFKNNDKIPRLV